MKFLKTIIFLFITLSSYSQEIWQLGGSDSPLQLPITFEQQIIADDTSHIQGYYFLEMRNDSLSLVDGPNIFHIPGLGLEAYQMSYNIITKGFDISSTVDGETTNQFIPFYPAQSNFTISGGSLQIDQVSTEPWETVGYLTKIFRSDCQLDKIEVNDSTIRIRIGLPDELGLSVTYHDSIDFVVGSAQDGNGYWNQIGLDLNYVNGEVLVGTSTPSTFADFTVGNGKIHFSNNDVKYNSMIGYNSGPNTTGKYNTFYGYNSGTSVTTGEKNVILGYKAGESATDPDKVVYLGYQTGINATGDSNMGIGGNACKDCDGNFNLAIGWNTLISSGSSSNNTALGSGAGGFATGSDNVFIGFSSGFYETGSHKLYISNSNTASPLIYGEFDNDLVKVNGDFESTGEIVVGDLSGTGTKLAMTDDNGKVVDGSYSDDFNIVGGELDFIGNINDADSDTLNEGVLSFVDVGNGVYRIESNSGGATPFFNDNTMEEGYKWAVSGNSIAIDVDGYARQSFAIASMNDITVASAASYDSLDINITQFEEGLTTTDETNDEIEIGEDAFYEVKVKGNIKTDGSNDLLYIYVFRNGSPQVIANLYAIDSNWRYFEATLTKEYFDGDELKLKVQNIPAQDDIYLDNVFWEVSRK